MTRDTINEKMRDSRAERVYGDIDMLPMRDIEEITDEMLGILNAILESRLPPSVDQTHLVRLQTRLAQLQSELQERQQSGETDEPEL